MKRIFCSLAVAILTAVVGVGCDGDDSPYNRTCYVPGVSYSGPERGLVYFLFYGADGTILYRAVGVFNALDAKTAAVVDDCFFIPYFAVTRVKAWIGVGDDTPSDSCFGPSSSPATCKPRPTDPQGEIPVSLKPREANRIVVPLRKLP